MTTKGAQPLHSSMLSTAGHDLTSSVIGCSSQQSESGTHWIEGRAVLVLWQQHNVLMQRCQASAGLSHLLLKPVWGTCPRLELLHFLLPTAHHRILQYLCTHFVSTLAVFQNLIVQHTQAGCLGCAFTSSVCAWPLQDAKVRCTSCCHHMCIPKGNNGLAHCMMHSPCWMAHLQIKDSQMQVHDDHGLSLGFW